MSDIGVEEYGYPSIDFLGEGHIRVTQGWFFPDIYPDEAAWYLDYYFNEEGQCEIILDGCWVLFDFWTHLKDYQMGFISGTFAENFKIPDEISMNEIELNSGKEVEKTVSCDSCSNYRRGIVPAVCVGCRREELEGKGKLNWKRKSENCV